MELSELTKVLCDALNERLEGTPYRATTRMPSPVLNPNRVLIITRLPTSTTHQFAVVRAHVEVSRDGIIRLHPAIGLVYKVFDLRDPSFSVGLLYGHICSILERSEIPKTVSKKISKINPAISAKGAE